MPKSNTQFSKDLMAWYRRHKRDLPWRHTSDPYHIWISEIMLQQTTVKTVIPYYERWITKYPTIRHVARAPVQNVLKQWQGLGYYQRARNIHKCAKVICSDHLGIIPDSVSGLKKLPGFGPYTIGAVLSIAYDKKLPLVDANVRRVMMRFLAIQGYADPSQDQKILRFLEKSLPSKNVGNFNQALMELGALICRNQNPLCLSCPMKRECQGYLKGIQDIIPSLKKKIIREVHVSIGVMQKQGKFFMKAC